MHVVKTMALISFAVTVELICAFVFTYADCLFSHAEAQMMFGLPCIWCFLVEIQRMYHACRGRNP